MNQGLAVAGAGRAGGEPDGLKGEAAKAFREAVAKQPPRWFKASEAFGKAADAMGRFAETVEWAQGQAKEALEDYNKAKKTSEDARSAYNKQVTEYNNAITAKKEHLPPRPAETFADPGKPLAAAAQEKLDRARKQRNEQAQTAATAVRAAREAAPPKPSYTDQLADGIAYMQLANNHFVGGIIRGAAGTADFARSLSPQDPYNLTHPAEYMTHLNSTAAGLVSAVNDPWGAGKQMLDEFMKDPTEGVGRLVPDLIGSKGMAAFKEVGPVARHVDDLAGAGRRALAEDGPELHSRPDEGKTTGPTEPVDLATGRMYLPQTDLVLPGVLPLIFTRRAESGYTAGRWFGPTWASTIDQHLEIDAEGVVLVSDDGLLVAYPHPAPGLPVLPETGPGHPLDRTPDGDWTLTDPVTGRTRRFSPTAGWDGEGSGLAHIVQLEDRNGNLIAFEYDHAGTPTGMVHSGGYNLRFETAEGRITALRLADGTRILAYGYDEGNLTEVVNSSGRPLRLTYDDRGRITSWTDTNDSRYDYAYDDQDRCIAQGGSEGHLALILSYGTQNLGSAHRVTSVTTADGCTRRYLIDERCRVVAEIDPLGAETRYEYDTTGRVTSRTDPLGATCRQEYD